jgi:hypothetical protein
LEANGQWVGSQVELDRLGVEAEEDVLVGAEGQQRLIAACSDLVQLGLFFGRLQSSGQGL